MKTLLTICCLISTLWSGETQTTLRLYEKIVGALAMDRQDVKLYSNSTEITESLKRKYPIVDTMKKADVAIVDRLEGKVGCKPVVFATNFTLLESHPDIVGALFWKKGRVQLLFIDERLRRCGITLPPFLRRYSIEKL